MSEAKEENPYEVTIGLMLALITIVAAVVAWRASVAGDGAGDADFAGLRATLNVEEANALILAKSYEHYGAYTDFINNLELSNRLEKELANTPTKDQPALVSEKSIALDVALTNQDFFPARYLSHSNEYLQKREQAELLAQAAREADLAPDHHYAEADKLREKLNTLMAILIAFAVSIFMLTLVEVVRARYKFPVLLLAGLISTMGIVLALWVELGA